MIQLIIVKVQLLKFIASIAIFNCLYYAETHIYKISNNTCKEKSTSPWKKTHEHFLSFFFSSDFVNSRQINMILQGYHWK